MNTKRRDDSAFKERAVKLSYERSSIPELASKLAFCPIGFTVGVRSFPIMVLQVSLVMAVDINALLFN